MTLYKICFSPTGGTNQVTECIANELEATFVSIDLTDRKTHFHDITLTKEDIALIAVPSYGGRVPGPAAERIVQIQGNGARAILVCVYGNRAYEDTLIELQDLTQQAGFTVIAAVTAIAEHSIAHKYATGRPDTEDYKQLKEFAGLIKEKLEKKENKTPFIPGNRPYRTSGRTGIIPKTSKECTRCGLCYTRCPVGAIDKDNPAKVNKQVCISCMRCISICPHHAKRINRLLLAIVNRMLKKACSERKTGELYL